MKLLLILLLAVGTLSQRDNTCSSQRGQRHVGDIIRHSQTSSVDGCCRMCNDDAECKSFTYDSSSICFLHSEIGVSQAADYNTYYGESKKAVTCGRNEHRNDCGNKCENTCDTRHRSVSCPQPCDGPPVCNCDMGFFRHNGQCIAPEQCPSASTSAVTCGRNEHRNDCGNKCENTCDTRNHNIGCPNSCDGPPVCNCNPGFFRHNGQCIAPEQCPSASTSAVYQDCAEIKEAHPHSSSGNYDINVCDGRSCTVYHVYCDMDTYGGGWTVIQRRIDGSENFYRNWREYAAGFGNTHGEYWLGNDAVYLLTQRKTYKLLVDLQDHNRDCRLNAEYSSFKLTSRTKYTLQLGRFERGIAGDSLSYHNGKHFSTFDQDNDYDSRNCAQTSSGAWWYNSCSYSSLNGPYQNPPGCTREHGKNINWYHAADTHQYSLRESIMMLRPVNFRLHQDSNHNHGHCHSCHDSNWCATKPNVRCSNKRW